MRQSLPLCVTGGRGKWSACSWDLFLRRESRAARRPGDGAVVFVDGLSQGAMDHQDFTVMRLRPVISAGCGSPIRCSMVGGTSARETPSAMATLRLPQNPKG